MIWAGIREEWGVHYKKSGGLWGGLLRAYGELMEYRYREEMGIQEVLRIVC
jgi:hypothetical protein